MEDQNIGTRFVGLSHKRKRTVDGEARPTEVAIDCGDKNVVEYEIESDQAEHDFVFGLFPTEYRKVTPEDKPEAFVKHQIKWRAVTADEDPTLFPEHQVRKVGKKMEVMSKVPCAFDGLKAGDVVGMMLGGSGDMLSYALVRRAEQIGAQVFRIPPFQLKLPRGAESDPPVVICDGDGEPAKPAKKTEKEGDAPLLSRLVNIRRDLFYPVQPRDKDIILVRERYRCRMAAQKARIACELQLHQVLVGQIHTLTSHEADIEKRFEQAKANDKILINMETIEKEANDRLLEAIEATDVYQKVFSPIEGIGPALAARIISGIVDIRRFPNRDKFVAFCGVSPNKQGKFRRKRRGENCNWSPSVRQGLYLFSEQANRRPGSDWGSRFRKIKANLRAKHPLVVVEAGKRRYTDGHIHRMATWKMLVKFARHIYAGWRNLEAGTASSVTKAA